MRKTKIICTLGPASSDEQTIEKMLKAGMNVARINFSHGTHESHRRTIAAFRRVRDRLGIPAAVMLDTRGPEIRLGDFTGGSAELRDGSDFTLTTRELPGTSERASVTYKGLPSVLKPGDPVLIDDGRIVLRTLQIKGSDMLTRVVHGGLVSDHKGINLPDTEHDMAFISGQDRADLLFGIEEDVDYVACSFVQRAEDVEAVRRLLAENGGSSIKLIAKIESAGGVRNFEKILAVSDGIMVARGDLGVELSYELLPGIQKRFIRRCVQAGKIVITATQMLESMVGAPIPTRAETTDVANAVFDGTSALMLSGETAAGSFPVEAVAAMSRIAEQAEKDMPESLGNGGHWYDMDSRDVTNAVAHAACTLAMDIGAAAIMAATRSGFTASRMSKFRPDIMIIGATPHIRAFHQMSLMWGVEPLIADQIADVEDLFDHFAGKAVASGLVPAGARIVVTAGLPVEETGSSNMIRVIRCGD